jgi:hypothetical protein
MRCQSCDFGYHHIVIAQTEPDEDGIIRAITRIEVCHDCGGTMVAHCCDGQRVNDREAE